MYQPPTAKPYFGSPYSGALIADSSGDGGSNDEPSAQLASDRPHGPSAAALSFARWIMPLSPPPQTSDPETLAQRARARSQERANASLGDLRLHVTDAARALEARSQQRSSESSWSKVMVRNLMDIESQKEHAERSIKAKARAKFRQMSSGCSSAGDPLSMRSGRSGGSGREGAASSSWMPWAGRKAATLLPAAERRGTLRTPLDVQREREEGLRTLREAFVLFNARSQSGALSPEEVLRMLRAMLPDAPQMSTEDALNFIADNEHEDAQTLSFDGFVRGVVALVSSGGSFSVGDDPDIAGAAEAVGRVVKEMERSSSTRRTDSSSGSAEADARALL